MLAASGYETKKELKAAVGEPLSYIETSMFGKEYKADGEFAVVGPSESRRKWFATVTMVGGKISKVS